VWRLAYEASDTGPLSRELAAGIRRVKRAKRLGVRVGNRLTTEQAKTFLLPPTSDDLRGKRDRAIISILVGCALRRAKLVELKVEDFQLSTPRRSLDNRGLGWEKQHIRAVPIPNWVKRTLDLWTAAAE
jgi:site-specific recombinase XerC